MAKQLEEIRAQYRREAYRFGSTVIIEIDIEGIKRKRVKAKGEAEELELTEGLWYRFYGRWTHHWRYGDQFLFQTFTAMVPLDKDGMIRYLCRAPNVGKVSAKKLVDEYGSDAVKKLREDPEKCAELVGKRFTLEKARQAAAFLEEERATEDAVIDLVGLFGGRGFPRNLPKRCIRRWGNRAHEIIRADPYELLAFRGVGFIGADALYCSLGLDPTAIWRQACCAWYVCASDTEGHTWTNAQDVKAELHKKIGAAAVRPREAIAWALGRDLLSVRRDSDGSIYLAERGRALSERALAEAAGGMLHYGEPEWPDISELDVSDHQRTELAKALRGRLALFGGSPGTGKTYTAARLISAIVKAHGSHAVAVVAPTGKAAVRISEALEEYGLSLRARTVHSYLEVGTVGEEGAAEDFGFRRGPQNPVEERFVIVDESSMLDTWLFAKLLGALRMDGHLLLVGDVNQLPPVGHGAPLRDLTQAGVPAGELVEIRRNAGAIVETCAAMRDERPWSPARQLDLEAGENLVLVPGMKPEEILEHISAILQRVRVGGQHDPVWDCQVIVAVNEKSPLSRKELNARLQAELNAGNRPQEEARFWMRDKVVCLRNSWFPISDILMEADEVPDTEELVTRQRSGKSGGVEVYVANGEIGRVMVEEPRRTMVEFFQPHRYVVVPKSEEGSGALDLAYAISAHKSQGSEWPIVIVALDEYGGARMVCDRSWLYTAISRARKACILVGLEKTAKDMCARVKIWKRRTFLREQLGEWLEKLKEQSREGQREEGAQGGEEGAEARHDAPVHTGADG